MTDERHNPREHSAPVRWLVNGIRFHLPALLRMRTARNVGPYLDDLFDIGGGPGPFRPEDR